MKYVQYFLDFTNVNEERIKSPEKQHLAIEFEKSADTKPQRECESEKYICENYKSCKDIKCVHLKLHRINPTCIGGVCHGKFLDCVDGIKIIRKNKLNQLNEEMHL